MKSQFVAILVAFMLLKGSLSLKKDKETQRKLRCFQCSDQKGSSKLKKCKDFNGSNHFIVDCLESEHSCLKGWVSDDDTEFRGCTKVLSDVCLLQDAGGACTCSTSLCNKQFIISPNISYFLILSFFLPFLL